MFTFAKRKVEVGSHWMAVVDQFNTSSIEFYQQIEKEIARCKVPGLEATRIEFSEGGMLSGKRTYLRFVRERLVFDVCASPLGTGYFFSCRTAEIPAVVRPAELFCLVILGFLIFYASIRWLGLFLGPFFLFCGLLGSIYVMRNAVAMGLEDLDRTLLRIPLLGPAYEAWIRRDTYFRQDSRMMYLDIVPRIVKRLAEDVTGTAGVRFTREYLRSPILEDLYKMAEPKGEISRTRIQTPVENSTVGI